MTSDITMVFNNYFLTKCSSHASLFLPVIIAIACTYQSHARAEDNVIANSDGAGICDMAIWSDNCVLIELLKRQMAAAHLSRSVTRPYS
jgi:hypothetical protein